MRRLLAPLLISLLCAASCVADGPVPAAQALAKRLLGRRASEFTFRLIPAAEGRDIFQVEADGGAVTIRGNNGISMASGLNWYLKYHCDCHVSLYGNQLDLPEVLPDVSPAIRRTSPHRHRYLLNYCAFGYSLAWWDWRQWERLIDWMALNGVNMPLAVTGQEAVWQAVGKRIGLTDEEMAEFIAGPPYLPFGWMGCLDGFGGPLPQVWIDEHVTLQKQILKRERSLGMTPVLQGFTGHVPRGVARLYPEDTLHEIHWIEWQTSLLEPTSPAFQEIGRVFLEEQESLFGTDHFYAADTFIEMTPPSGETEYLAQLSQAILSGMTAADPEATWVMQGWIFVNNPGFWTEGRARAFFDAVPDERLLLLDLFCESRPAWKETEGFYGKPWVWCVVQNFGRTIRLEGNIPKINRDLHEAVDSPDSGKLSGIGMVNEGLDYNPVAFEFLLEMAWRDEPVSPRAWIRDYAHHRYGRRSRAAAGAWEELLRLVYSRSGPSTSNVTLRPGLTPAGRTSYPANELLEAWRKLLSCADRFEGVDTYAFDVVNVGRQVLVNLTAWQHARVAQAFSAGDATALAAECAAYEELLRDLDRLLATREEFLLGRNIADARRWGRTPDERALYEWNSRNVLTLWGTGVINDYARKEWAGMIEGYYLGRWRVLVEEMLAAAREEREFDQAAWSTAIVAYEQQWPRDSERYPKKPRGDSVAIALELLETYGDSFAPNAVSLTTGKPVTCSDALPPFPPHLANDGVSWNTEAFWAVDVSDGKEAWWQVDLEEPSTVSRIVVVGYYGDARYYGFTVETSLDGETWEMVADMRDNTAPSTSLGYGCSFDARTARYIRVTQTHNSANTGRHLVEVMAYGE